MAIPHLLVLAAALVTLLCLPCAVAMLVCADDLTVRRAWSRRGRAELLALHRLDRELRDAGHPPMPGGAVMPTIEQLAADLRRLDGQRQAGPSMSSERWSAAVLHAYDQRLQLACRYLSVAQHLAAAHGIDRDIERIRLEAELQAAGLEFRSVAHRRPR
jgi:hypothetical protein